MYLTLLMKRADGAVDILVDFHFDLEFRKKLAKICSGSADTIFFRGNTKASNCKTIIELKGWSKRYLTRV